MRWFGKYAKLLLSWQHGRSREQIVLISASPGMLLYIRPRLQLSGREFLSVFVTKVHIEATNYISKIRCISYCWTTDIECASEISVHFGLSKGSHEILSFLCQSLQVKDTKTTQQFLVSYGCYPVPWECWQVRCRLSHHSLVTWTHSSFTDWLLSQVVLWPPRCIL